MCVMKLQDTPRNKVGVDFGELDEYPSASMDDMGVTLCLNVRWKSAGTTALPHNNISCCSSPFHSKVLLRVTSILHVRSAIDPPPPPHFAVPCM